MLSKFVWKILESFIISLLQNCSTRNWLLIRNSIFRLSLLGLTTPNGLMITVFKKYLLRIRINPDKFFQSSIFPVKKKQPNGNSNKILARNSRIRLKFPNFPNATQRTPLSAQIILGLLMRQVSRVRGINGLFRILISKEVARYTGPNGSALTHPP